MTRYTSGKLGSGAAGGQALLHHHVYDHIKGAPERSLLHNISYLNIHLSITYDLVSPDPSLDWRRAPSAKRAHRTQQHEPSPSEQVYR